MPAFDAERYLRILGEDTLVDDEQAGRGWVSSLEISAEALVAVGQIDPAGAEAVVSDYGAARGLRSAGGHRPLWRGSPGTPISPQEPGPLRVTSLDQVIELPEGTLRLPYALFRDDEISIAFRFRSNDPPGSERVRTLMRSGPLGVPWNGPGRLTDEHGATATVHMAGGGGGGHWSGHLTAGAPLSVDTRTLTLDGHELTLGADAPRARARIESLRNADPARAHLWHLLATGNGFHGPSDPEPAIAALIAAGSLDPADPSITEVRAVHTSLPSHRGMPPSGGSSSLPDPWRSLISRAGAGDGPEGVVLVNAVTPQFDGHFVTIAVISSNPDAFTAEVMVSPDTHRGPFTRWLIDQLAWWARDDRGQHYLGSAGSWSGGGDVGHGEINFWPGIDPKATRLELTPTGRRERAVIEVPLSWGAG